MKEEIKNFALKFFNKVKGFIKNNPKKIVFLLIVLIFGFFFFGHESSSVQVGHLENGNLQESVSVTGGVAPNQESSLAFEKSGKIQSVNVKVGDKVYKGQRIASLSSGSEYASVLNAQAILQSALANLQDAKNGPNSADLAVKQSAIDAATANLNLDYSSVGDTIRNANVVLSDITSNQLASIFYFDGQKYSIAFDTCSQLDQSKIELDRLNIDTELSKINSLSQSFFIDTLSISEAGDKVDSSLKEIYNSSIYMSDLLNSLNKLLNLSCFSNDPTATVNRAKVSSARSSISTLLSNINSTKSKILSDRNVLVASQKSLEQIRVGTSAEKIKSLEAVVNQARASLVSAQSANAKNFLVSPFSGTVTKVDANVGEISSPNSPVVTVMSDNNLELKIKLSEIDLVKVKLGNDAKVYLDTYGKSKVFDGVVSEIDPAATKDGNNSYYGAKIDFTNKDEDVKSGMNGSADIITSEKVNADYILARYIKVIGENSFVRVIKDMTKLKDIKSVDTDPNLEIRKIETGLRSNDGKIEILSGLTSSDNMYPYEDVVSSSTNK